MKTKKPSQKRHQLRTGDTVMVIAGGNSEKRPNKGKKGKILRFVGDSSERAVVEGLNFIAKHKRASGPGESGGRITVEGSIHVSNLMYFAEKEGRPVRLCHSFLEDGQKVRGYKSPKTKEFVQIEESR